MPIVRPLRSCSESVRHSCSLSRSSTGSSASRPRRSWSKVVSRDSDLATRTSSSSRSSSKRAQAGQVRAQVAPEPFGQPASRAPPPARRGWRCRGPPAARASSGRCPGSARGSARRSARTPARGVSSTKPSGFSASDATLATSLFGPIPIEQHRPAWLEHRRLHPASRRPVAVEAGQVEVGLVEPDHLDALHLVAQHRHHLARARAVELEVGRQEDRVRAQPPRALGRAWRRRRRSGAPRSWPW